MSSAASTKQLPFTLTSVEFELTAQRIEDYARAIDDPSPRYCRQGRDCSHMVMPPGLAPAFMQEPVRRLFDDAKALAQLDIDGTRVVFGEITYTFHDQLRPGDWVTVGGALVERAAKATRELLTFQTAATNDRGTRVLSADILFIRL